MRSATALSRCLRLLAPIVVAAGAAHVLLGLGADALLGANIAPATRMDPSLDSQNRFYGAAFTLYGALLWIAAGDLRRYRRPLTAALWIFFAAGLARFVSVALYGWPAPPVMLLLVLEILLPPVLLLWIARACPVDSAEPTGQFGKT